MVAFASDPIKLASCCQSHAMLGTARDTIQARYEHYPFFRILKYENRIGAFRMDGG
jgi:hypothetical protein